MAKAPSHDNYRSLLAELHATKEELSQLKAQAVQHNGVDGNDDSMEMAYWEWNRHERYRFKSPALLKMLAYPAGDYEESFWWDMVVKEDIPGLKLQLEQYLQRQESEPLDLKVQGRKADGSLRRLWIRLKVSEWNADGRPEKAMGSIFDITDILNTRLLHQQTSDRLQLIIEGTEAGIWDWDLITMKIWWSARFDELLGYQPGELQPDFDLFIRMVHPDDRERTQEAIDQHLNHHLPYKIEYRLQTKNGSYRWFEATGKALRDDDRPTRMAGTIINIDRRKSMELELQEQNTLFKEAEHLARVGSWQYDIVKNKIRWSEQVYHIYELPLSTPINLDLIRSFVPEGQQSDFNERVQRAIKEKQPYEYEAQIQLQDGRKKWVRSKGIPGTNSQGDVTSIIGVIQDIDSQKKSEEHLRLLNQQLEEKQAMLMQSEELAGLGTWHLYFENMRPVWSDMVYKIHGLEPGFPNDYDRILGEFYQEHVEEINLNLERATRGESFEMEVEINTYSGEAKWVRIYGSPLRNEQGKIIGVRGAIQDVDERKRREIEMQELNRDVREQNAIFREAERAAQVGSWEYNAVTQKLFWSEGVYHIHELNPNLPPSLDEAFQYVCEPYREEVEHALDRALNQGVPYEMQLKLRSANNNIKWVIVKTIPVEGHQRVRGILHDITDLKERKNALRRSNQELEKQRKLLVQAEKLAALGYWEWLAGSAVVTWSEQLRQIFEVPEDFVPNAEYTFKNFYTPADADLLRHKVDQVLEHGEKFSLELEVITYKGQRKWVQLQGSALINLNSEIIGSFGTIQDIDDLKKKELELEQTSKVISEQNTRLMNFTQIVSHNLRSHSSNIQTMLDFLENGNSKDDERTYLSYIRETADNMEETLAHLHEVIKIREVRDPGLEVLKLEEVLQSVLHILEGEIQKYQVAMTFDLQVNELHYSRNYLESILLNLISNAIKYRSPERSPLIQIRSYREKDGKQVVLEVKDNGMGFNYQKHKHKLFGMYKTFHNHPNARGIGLFITKNQVESLGGHIEAFSTEGEGTVFSVYLG